MSCHKLIQHYLFYHAVFTMKVTMFGILKHLVRIQRELKKKHIAQQ